MKLNSYSIFSDRSSSRPDTKSLGCDQTSILRDLDPSAAKFQVSAVGEGKNVLLAAFFLLFCGGLAWFLIFMLNGTDSHTEAPGMGNAKSEIAGMPSAVASMRPQGKVDGGDKSGNPAVSAPAIIRGSSLSSSAQDGSPVDKAKVSAGNNMSNSDEKNIGPEPLAPVAPPLVRKQDVDGSKVQREKKNDPHLRNSQSVAFKPAFSEKGLPQANRSSQSEKHATERDVEIITVLVK